MALADAALELVQRLRTQPNKRRYMRSSLDRTLTRLSEMCSYTTLVFNRLCAQLAEMYSQIIKLSSENKINAKNSWSLNLIDHMDR